MQWTKLVFRNTAVFTVQKFLIHFELSEEMYLFDILCSQLEL